MEDVKWSDVVIFTGGEDVTPELRGEENTASSNNLRRDAVECFTFLLAQQLNKKILGVCRGHQFINTMLQGKLTQDISPQHFGHHTLDNDTLLFGKVNSHHHQGVLIPGEGLTAMGSHEGIIEVTKSNKVFSVQFHPEFEDSPGIATNRYLEEVERFLYV
jgi:putative glutamine amidotransferase